MALSLARGNSPMAQVNFRIQDERLRMIDAAAKYRGVSRTEFVMRASEAAAIEAHTERHVDTLGEDAFAAFQDALDAPVEPNDQLRALLARTPIWEQ